MNKSVKIGLLGLMIWGITFIAGFFIFAIFGADIDGPPIEALWINGISAFKRTKTCWTNNGRNRRTESMLLHK